LQAPIWKKPITKMAGGVAQGVGPEFKPQYYQKNPKQNKTKLTHITSTKTGNTYWL
jgi:hypothetical protein